MREQEMERDVSAHRPKAKPMPGKARQCHPISKSMSLLSLAVNPISRAIAMLYQNQNWPENSLHQLGLILQQALDSLCFERRLPNY